MEDISRSVTNRTNHVNRVLLTLASTVPVEQWARIVVLRMLISVDTLTSDWAKLEHDLLDSMASEIQAENSDVDAVLLDVTQKPPGTMEWE
jgi:GMP synthase PP-ATPase subunit